MVWQADTEITNTAKAYVTGVCTRRLAAVSGIEGRVCDGTDQAEKQQSKQDRQSSASALRTARTLCADCE